MKELGAFLEMNISLARLKLLATAGATYIILQFLIRIIFTITAVKSVSLSIYNVVIMLILGLGYDICISLYLLTPLALMVFLAGDKFLNNKYGKRIIKFMLWFYSFVLAFTTISEYFFWEEFHTRFNFIAVDYLVYTQELFGNIYQSYNIPLLLASLLALIWCIYKVNLQGIDFSFEKSLWGQRFKRVMLYAFGIALLTVCLTSGLKNRLLTNLYNQEIAGNGIYQFVYAFFHNELDYERFYKSLDNKLVIGDLKATLGKTGEKLSEDNSIARNIVNHNKHSKEKPNIIFIVVESLSGRFTGMDNNKESLTPYLDELARKNFYFNKVYATGTRTVRGLEAVALNLPPTPGQSIVRRENCNNMYNVGTALRAHGYKTEFIYGGYGYFDNMNAFFEGNGFGVLDRNSIPKEEIIHETVWGVADEILFEQCIKQMDKHYELKEPALQIVLTTTNHRPFTFPEGRINAPQGKRPSVVKYTDWAIDNFLKKAKTKAWFENTVFVILADHNALAAGRVELPISNYRIPCIVYGPKFIQQGHNDRLMSQIDVMPTVLGMLGMSYVSKNLGYDINKLPLGEERAFISTYQKLGYVKQDKLVVLEPGKKATVYKILDYNNDKYEKINDDKALINEAISWYQGASYLFRNDLLKEKSKNM